MYEDNCLIYLDWEVCTKHEIELPAGSKNNKLWKPDSSGVVRERIVERAMSADTSTDLKLRFTLQRRGLALDIADLLAFEQHQKIVDWLLGEFHRVAPDGYSKVSIKFCNESAANRLAIEPLHAFRVSGLARASEEKSVQYDPLPRRI